MLCQCLFMTDANEYMLDEYIKKESLTDSNRPLLN